MALRPLPPFTLTFLHSSILVLHSCLLVLHAPWQRGLLARPFNSSNSHLQHFQFFSQLFPHFSLLFSVSFKLLLSINLGDYDSRILACNLQQRSH